MPNFIQKHIANNGSISFSEFMNLALYHPEHGYYRNGSAKFGAAGDFMTAPELTPLFGQCLARYYQKHCNEYHNACILEFGAGTGRLAIDILTALATQGCLPKQYYILELSAELQQRQQMQIAETIPSLFDRVVWLNQLPEQAFNGLVIANEVLDAMPVELFHYSDTEVTQGIVNQDLKLEFIQPSPKFITQVQANIPGALPNNYMSEINLNIKPWLTSLFSTLGQAQVLLIDYGFLQDEYYHPQRSQGTLMCHYQHRAHSDPFIHIGEQDITAHVDFSAVIDAAQQCGFTIDNFSTQANFLLEQGLAELGASDDIKQQLVNAQVIKQLIMPSEMGELFKVLVLRKNAD